MTFNNKHFFEVGREKREGGGKMAESERKRKVVKVRKGGYVSQEEILS